MEEYYKIIKKDLYATSYYLIKETDNDIESLQFYEDNTGIKTDILWAYLTRRLLVIGEKYNQITTEFKNIQEVENFINKFPKWEKTPYYVRIHSKANETIKFKYLFFLSTKTHLPVINPIKPDTDGFSSNDIRSLIYWLSRQTGAFPLTDMVKLTSVIDYTDEALFNAWKFDNI